MKTENLGDEFGARDAVWRANIFNASLHKFGRFVGALAKHLADITVTLFLFSALNMIEANGNGELRAQTHIAAALIGSHENSAADVFACCIQNRVSRLQQADVRQRTSSLPQKGLNLCCEGGH